MPDRPRDPNVGVHGMWDETRPPSRGQLATIAVLACRLLGIEQPTSRSEASIVEARIRRALSDGEVQRAVADAQPF